LGLSWTNDGQYIASASYDGHARIWSPSGELKRVCAGHNGPVFALKWNKKGSRLVTSGSDKACIVWDPLTGNAIQTYNIHTAPTLDVDWQNNDVFASCSTDTTIQVLKVGQKEPIRTFSGHTDEVNAIRWDPSGTMLASASDDQYLKIWTLNSGLAHDLHAHSKEVFSLRWSPAGPGSTNPNGTAYLASASFDKTVKIWDPTRGICMHKLVGHQDSVYSIAFSPDNQILASGGSTDGFCYLWDVRSGNKLGSYKLNEGGVLELAWNNTGSRIALAGANKQVTVLDIRNPIVKSPSYC